jgi:hypothetical protein
MAPNFDTLMNIPQGMPLAIYFSVNGATLTTPWAATYPQREWETTPNPSHFPSCFFVILLENRHFRFPVRKVVVGLSPVTQRIDATARDICISLMNFFDGSHVGLAVTVTELAAWLDMTYTINYYIIKRAKFECATAWLHG